jgi:uncharacterized protein YaeQ
MSAKYSFELKSEDKRRDLPHKLLLVQHETETRDDVLLKLLAYLLFYRERLQVEPRLDPDAVPFLPSLAEVDFEVRVRLWIDCGAWDVKRLDRLAVKVPEADIWLVQRAAEDVAGLVRAMTKAGLRRNRYHLLAFDSAMFDELAGLLTQRNHVVWVEGGFDPPEMHFDFNGLWFDSEFSVTRF